MRFGLVDIGSNSVKCNIYEYNQRNESLHLLLMQSRTVGLIQYIEHSVLSENGISVLMQVIDGYCRLIKELHGERVVCVATASLRNLRNGDAICGRVSDAFGCEMRIISGEEEAMLGYQAACASLGLDGKRGILIDMGGASTEMTAFDHGEIVHFVSLPFGCLSLYLSCVSSVLPNDEERKAVIENVDAHLSQISWLAEYGEDLYLIGGTAKLMGKIICGDAFCDGVSFMVGALSDACQSYRNPGKNQLRRIIETAPDRLHTFSTGMIAYQCIARAAGAKRFTVSFAGVRDGLARTVLSNNKGEQ